MESKFRDSSNSDSSEEDKVPHHKSRQAQPAALRRRHPSSSPSPEIPSRNKHKRRQRNSSSEESEEREEKKARQGRKRPVRSSDEEEAFAGDVVGSRYSFKKFPQKPGRQKKTRRGRPSRVIHSSSESNDDEQDKIIKALKFRYAKPIPIKPSLTEQKAPKTSKRERKRIHSSSSDEKPKEQIDSDSDDQSCGFFESSSFDALSDSYYNEDSSSSESSEFEESEPEADYEVVEVVQDHPHAQSLVTDYLHYKFNNGSTSTTNGDDRFHVSQTISGSAKKKYKLRVSILINTLDKEVMEEVNRHIQSIQYTTIKVPEATIRVLCKLIQSSKTTSGESNIDDIAEYQECCEEIQQFLKKNQKAKPLKKVTIVLPSPENDPQANKFPIELVSFSESKINSIKSLIKNLKKLLVKDVSKKIKIKKLCENEDLPNWTSLLNMSVSMKEFETLIPMYSNFKTSLSGPCKVDVKITPEMKKKKTLKKEGRIKLKYFQFIITCPIEFISDVEKELIRKLSEVKFETLDLVSKLEDFPQTQVFLKFVKKYKWLDTYPSNLDCEEAFANKTSQLSALQMCYIVSKDEQVAMLVISNRKAREALVSDWKEQVKKQLAAFGKNVKTISYERQANKKIVEENEELFEGLQYVKVPDPEFEDEMRLYCLPFEIEKTEFDRKIVKIERKLFCTVNFKLYKLLKKTFGPDFLHSESSIEKACEITSHSHFLSKLCEKYSNLTSTFTDEENVELSFTCRQKHSDSLHADISKNSILYRMLQCELTSAQAVRHGTKWIDMRDIFEEGKDPERADRAKYLYGSAGFKFLQKLQSTHGISINLPMSGQSSNFHKYIMECISDTWKYKWNIQKEGIDKRFQIFNEKINEPEAKLFLDNFLRSVGSNLREDTIFEKSSKPKQVKAVKLDSEFFVHGISRLNDTVLEEEKQNITKDLWIVQKNSKTPYRISKTFTSNKSKQQSWDDDKLWLEQKFCKLQEKLYSFKNNEFLWEFEVENESDFSNFNLCKAKGKRSDFKGQGRHMRDIIIRLEENYLKLQNEELKEPCCFSLVNEDPKFHCFVTIDNLDKTQVGSIQFTFPPCLGSFKLYRYNSYKEHKDEQMKKSDPYAFIRNSLYSKSSVHKLDSAKIFSKYQEMYCKQGHPKEKLPFSAELTSIEPKEMVKAAKEEIMSFLGSESQPKDWHTLRAPNTTFEIFKLLSTEIKDFVLSDILIAFQSCFCVESRIQIFYPGSKELLDALIYPHLLMENTLDGYNYIIFFVKLHFLECVMINTVPNNERNLARGFSTYLFPPFWQLKPPFDYEIIQLEYGEPSEHDWVYSSASKSEINKILDLLMNFIEYKQQEVEVESMEVIQNYECYMAYRLHWHYLELLGSSFSHETYFVKGDYDTLLSVSKNHDFYSFYYAVKGNGLSFEQFNGENFLLGNDAFMVVKAITVIKDDEKTIECLYPSHLIKLSEEYE